MFFPLSSWTIIPQNYTSYRTNYEKYQHHEHIPWTIYHLEDETFMAFSYLDTQQQQHLENIPTKLKIPVEKIWVQILFYYNSSSFLFWKNIHNYLINESKL